MPILLQRHELNVNGAPLVFFAPKDDHTIYGTLSCIQNRKFHIDDIGFVAGDVMVDIGCNVGLLSLLCARLWPDITIYAFDASATAIECLRQSAAANAMTNIQAFTVAVGDRFVRDVRFFSDGQNVTCLVQDEMHTNQEVLDSSVNMIAIDDIFDSTLLDIAKVKYLKMDIEGGEFPIFERLFEHRADILDRIDHLHLEIHEFEDKGPEALRAKVIERFGKRVFFDT